MLAACVMQTSCSSAALAVSIFWDRSGFAEAEACRGLGRCRQKLVLRGTGGIVGIIDDPFVY
mgnify:CR=1 FL=1